LSTRSEAREDANDAKFFVDPSVNLTWFLKDNCFASRRRQALCGRFSYQTDAIV
jgi:hypothetical protein